MHGIQAHAKRGARPEHLPKRTLAFPSRDLAPANTYCERTILCRMGPLTLAKTQFTRKMCHSQRTYTMNLNKVKQIGPIEGREKRGGSKGLK